MEKLRLDPDEVAVESFPTGGEAGERKGTVHGAACTFDYTCLCQTGNYYCGQRTYSCDYSELLPCPTSVYEC